LQSKPSVAQSSAPIGKSVQVPVEFSSLQLRHFPHGSLQHTLFSQKPLWHSPTVWHAAPFGSGPPLDDELELVPPPAPPAPAVPPAPLDELLAPPPVPLDELLAPPPVPLEEDDSPEEDELLAVPLGVEPVSSRPQAAKMLPPTSRTPIPDENDIERLCAMRSAYGNVAGDRNKKKCVTLGKSAAGGAAGVVGNDGRLVGAAAYRSARVVSADELWPISTSTGCIRTLDSTGTIGAALNLDIGTLARILANAIECAMVLFGALDHRIPAAATATRTIHEATEAGWTCHSHVFACVLRAAREDAHAWVWAVDPGRRTGCAGGWQRDAAFT